MHVCVGTHSPEVSLRCVSSSAICHYFFFELGLLTGLSLSKWERLDACWSAFHQSASVSVRLRVLMLVVGLELRSLCLYGSTLSAELSLQPSILFKMV